MPRINWIKVVGFRAFGSVRQDFTFRSGLSVVWGSNSQGKTSLAEAFEFLLTGTTVRREFMASAAREFSDCLRNVHLPSGTEVSVEAEIVGADGVAHVVKRRLQSDYSATSACTSTLTVDGAPANDLLRLGIRLSHPPLAAPVLMQHTLRFVLSAKPQERTDYFKALLEIGDLERIRVAIDRAKPQTTGQSDPVLQKLDRCGAAPEMVKVVARIRKQEPSRTGLNAALGQLVDLLLPAEVASGKTLEERTRLLKEDLAARRKTSFPIEAFTHTGAGHHSMPEDGLWGDLESFATLVEATDKEASRLAQLFSQLLQLPSVSNAAAPIDCPVCATPAGLTPARIELIRAQVRSNAEYSAGLRKAEGHVQTLSSLVDQAARAIKHASPGACWWDASTRSEKGFTEAAMTALLGPDASSLVEAWRSEDAALTTAITTLVELGGQIRTQLKALRLDELKKVAIQELKSAFAKFDKAAAAVEAILRTALPAHDRIRKALEAEVGKNTKTQGWQDVVDVVEARDQLLTSLIGVIARQKVVAEWERAVRDLDAAIAAVFDTKFGDLGDEITRWWKLLRPEESATFSGIQRAGTGRRFIDLKAGLASGSAGEPLKLRDAVAVFSDSQLNCLGLAAFLARSVRENSGFVVLDDPVPASDREHRAMFIHRVLDELVRSGFHVILLTHDDDTWKDVQERNLPNGATIERTVLDDTLPGGPHKKPQKWVAPFAVANREAVTENKCLACGEVWLDVGSVKVTLGWVVKTMLWAGSRTEINAVPAVRLRTRNTDWPLLLLTAFPVVTVSAAPGTVRTSSRTCWAC